MSTSAHEIISLVSGLNHAQPGVTAIEFFLRSPVRPSSIIIDVNCMLVVDKFICGPGLLREDELGINAAGFTLRRLETDLAVNVDDVFCFQLYRVPL